jgi:2-polyprenyl-3-methyl-5-hydroxy-6-metoxy-1,4-benzoquinol methylase
MSSLRNRSAHGAGFTFKDVDHEGEQVLDAMSLAPRFNRWMFQTIRPYCASPVLEVGSGIGNISEYLLRAGLEAHLSDVRPHYCARLRDAFGRRSNCNGVSQLDLVHPDFACAHAAMLGKFATVFALNVVEHIADDHQAIANCRKLLRPGGQLIVLVPAYRFLYNRIDRELCHYRRYTRRTLNALFHANHLDVVDSFYFNLAGALGWFVSGSLLRAQAPSPPLVRLYNRLVRLFRLVDRLTLRRFGLSVVAVGRAAEVDRLPVAA